ncbi:MAG TPA: DUF4102 domain-containing protein [Pseudomonas xinjiangensis]|uniref:DUF4102 domain-containing protein n=2 Tax=root TaxID=1 RepID=A0A7V1BL78_9GAMM|nr:DUF4102 domain-containing protein [Halopseudomonas xinjiangensis]HEC47543.1 DUF4102 domain-containing protein [Halopseudomonas xinjiangensis]
MKRSEIKRRPMADTVLAALEPEDKEYREKYNDDRLYFTINPSGRKRWDLRYKKPGSQTWSWLGLGSYPKVSAKQAKEEVTKIIALLDAGIDPVKEKDKSKTLEPAPVINSFRSAAEGWYQKKVDDGRAEKTLAGIRICLKNDIMPAIGDKEMTTITRADCAAIQEKIEKRGAHNTSEKARTWLNQIFGWAIAKGLTENNPASNLADIAAKAPEEKQYPHLLEAELPDFLNALRKSPSRMIALTASWMVVRTASRPGMVRFAEWTQIDFEAKLWSVPNDIMKMGRDHLVPLPDKVIEDLIELRKLTGRSRYIFPSAGDKCPVISDGTINKVFKLVGYEGKMTGHGSRHTCKTLLSEHGWPNDWSEAQLAHKKPGLKGVYDKAAYLVPRIKMMQWYSDYITALELGMKPDKQKEFQKRVVQIKSEHAE